MKHACSFKKLSLLGVSALFSFSVFADDSENYESAVRIADYVQNTEGASWQYENIARVGKSPILMGIGSETTFEGIQVSQREENNGDYRYQTVDDNGVRVYQLYFKGDFLVTYSRPAQVFPAWVRPGDKMYDRVNYKFTKMGGDVIETGVQHYDIEVLPRESVDVPTGHYADALPIRTKAERQAASGERKGYDLTEWFAIDVGAVKVQGEIYWVDSEGARKSMPVDAALEKTNMPIATGAVKQR